MTTIAMVLTVIYNTLQVLNELWDGPLGKAFRDWYDSTHKLPNKKEAKKIRAPPK